MTRIPTVRASLLLVAGFLSLAVAHSADGVKRIDIPAGELSDALIALSKQYGIDLFYRPEQVKGLKTEGVHGELTTTEAVERLIEGTELKLSTDSTGAMVIGVEERSTAAMEAESSAIRMAQSSPATPTGVAQQEPGSSNGPSSASENSAGEKLEEVTVRGKPYTDANVDIVRTENDVQPYYIFKSDDIAKANVVNLEDFLKQRLTMNAVANTNSQSQGAYTNNSQVNLRGFGLDQTLILVNGRRTAGRTADNGAALAQFDLNSFSPAMIDRIEVLPSSASAIYGGSAVGGVLNVILKRDFTGGDVQLTYDTPLDVDAPIIGASAAYGWSLEEDRTHITLSAAYRDSDSLRSGDRPEFLQRGISRILQRSPELLYSANNPFRYGAVPNIASADGSALTFKGGGTLGSSLTYVPEGTSLSTSIAQLQAGLLANAGQQSTTLPENYDRTGLLAPLAQADETKSVLGAIRRKMSDRLELTAEVFYNEHDIRGAWWSSNDPYYIPASSPANPFEQDVRIAAPYPGRTAITGDNRSLRVVGAFVLDLPHEWRAQGDYTWNRQESSTSFVILDGASGFADIQAAFDDGTLNPFVDTMAHPLALDSYISTDDSWPSHSVSTLGDVGVRMSGPVGSLPAGRPILTVGLGHRQEKQPSGAYQQNRAFGLYSYLAQSQAVSSLYGEAFIPVVAAANGVPGVRRLDLQVASRFEDFSVTSRTATRVSFPPDYAPDPTEALASEKVDYHATNTTVGLLYKPVQALTLRASFATAFLPPGFSDFLPGVVNPTGSGIFLDPRRGNELSGPVALLGGGNPDLEPMEAETTNIGLLFEPEFWPGLRVGVEWFRTERTNLIFRPDFTELLTNESLYPGRVVRTDPAPGDPYPVGPITLFDASAINARHVTAEGFDLAVGYRMATEQHGTFSVDVLGTIIDKFTRQVSLQGVEQDIVGKVSSQGPLELRANATLGWERGPWSLGWTALYYSSYDQFDDPFYVAAQGGTTVPHQLYHNALASYRFESDGPTSGSGRWLSGLNLTLGVRNVFNTVPPFDAFQRDIRYYSPFGDYRLRSIQLSVSKRF